MTQYMNRNLAVEIAEALKLNVTIKPDGTLIGDPVDIERLREQYKLNQWEPNGN